jgi:flagellar biosynthesis/type III secretory pathway protein FliH
MAPVARDDKDAMTVESYRPSEYTPATWPVVSDVRESTQFTPSSFNRVADAVYEVDGMFADFGSTPKQGTIELSREAGDFDLQPSGGEAVEEVVTAAEQLGADVHEGLEVIREERAHELMSNEHEAEAGDPGHRVQEEDDPSTHVDDPLNGEGTGAESVRINEDSLKIALKESYERGCADARREVAVLQEQLEERYRLLWEDMQTQLDESLRLNEARAVDLALQMAKRLVGDVVEQQREYIRHVIHEAIKVAAGAEISAIRVSPRDYDFLKLADYGDPKKFLSGTSLKFISDESIRAGCVLVTSAGEVDYDLDSACERIRSKAQQEPES